MGTYTKGYFYIDGMGEDVIEGYTNGDTWNGWQTPVFTFENAKKILGLLKSEYPESRYDEVSDTFIIAFEDDAEFHEKYSGTLIEVEGQAVKVYPIGTHSWVWEKLQNVKIFLNDPHFGGEDSTLLLSYSLGEGHSYAEVDFIVYNDNSYRWYVQVRADTFSNHDELLEELKKDYYWGEGASVTL